MNTKDIDKQYSESIRAEDQHFFYPQRISSFISIDAIKSITVINSTGGECDYAIEGRKVSWLCAFIKLC